MPPLAFSLAQMRSVTYKDTVVYQLSHFNFNLLAYKIKKTLSIKYLSFYVCLTEIILQTMKFNVGQKRSIWIISYITGVIWDREVDLRKAFKAWVKESQQRTLASFFSVWSKQDNSFLIHTPYPVNMPKEKTVLRFIKDK